MSQAKAERLFRDFHRRKPKAGEVLQVGMERAADALVVGDLVAIAYRLKGHKRPTYHRFKITRGRKVLVDSSGNQIFILGKTRFTSRGFID